MELFDVVDRNRRPLGYTKERGMELDENYFRIAQQRISANATKR